MNGVRVGGAVLLLSLAACLLLGAGSRRYSPHASAQVPVSPLSAALGQSASKSKPDAQSLLSHLPLIFEPNHGQADSSVKFVSRGQGYSLFLDQTGAVLAMQTATAQGRKLEAVRMTLVGANPAAQVDGSELLSGTSNYFIGNDPKQWHTGIPQFAGVHYRSVYQGIDLVFYGSQGHLEYDLKVAPGADPSQAEMQFDGASKLTLSNGNLILTGSGADVRMQAPRVYQRIAGGEQPVEGRFVLRAANRVGFEIGAYDRGRELIIDPTITYSTYFGGGGTTSAPFVAVNGNGFIYLAGSTTSGTANPPALPVTTNALQTTLNGTQNIFILELDPTAGASGVVYLTYLGGSGIDTAAGIAVDSGNNAYVAGTTTSPNFPTVNGFQSAPKAGSAGTAHVFVSEITQITSALPALNYSTYLSGSGTDVASAMTVDTNRDVFVIGTTTSVIPTSSPNPDAGSGFPSTSLPVPFQENPSPGSSIQFFVTEVNTNNIDTPSVPYSTYFGGGTPTGGSITTNVTATESSGTVTLTAGADWSAAYGVGSSINVYGCNVIGYNGSWTIASGGSGGTTLTYADTNTGLGNATGCSVVAGAVAIGGGIAVDTAGNVYFSGTTNFFNSGEGTNGTGGLQSTDFPIADAYQPCLDTPPPLTFIPPVTCTAPGTTPYPTDAFVAKLNPANAQTGATQLLFSTYFGGTGDDSSNGLGLDPTAAGVYITGATDSTDFVFPTNSGPFQQCLDTPVNPTPPATCPTFTTPPAPPTDAYVARFTNPTFSSGSTTNAVGLGYFSYVGGTGNDSGLAVGVDTASGAWVTGATSSGTIGTPSPTTGFPVTTGAIQSVLNGPQNAFFSHINTTTVANSSTNANANYSTYFGGNGVDRGTSATLDPSLNIYVAGDTTSTNLQTQGGVQTQLQGSMDAFAVKLRTATDLCINCVAVVYSSASNVVSAGTPVTVTFTVLNQGPDLATNVAVTGQYSGVTAAFNSATATGGTCSAPNGYNLVCTIPSLQSGSLSQVAFTVTPSQAGNGLITATVTSSNDTNLSNTNSASFTATNFSLSVTPSSATVLAGFAAPFYAVVSPAQTFGANVSLSCTGLPTGASCGFNPSTLSFNGPGSQTSFLNLTTTARPITTISSTKWRGPVYALWLMAPGMALIGFGRSRRRRNRVLGWLALATLLAFFALQPACSSPKQIPPVSGTPAGTYPITVTATSGSFSAPSVGITLTVQ